MPRVMITVVMPRATIPTNAKFLVTLNRFRSVAKVLVRIESPMQARATATVTQKAWRLTSQAIGCASDCWSIA